MSDVDPFGKVPAEVKVAVNARDLMCIMALAYIATENNYVIQVPCPEHRDHQAIVMAPAILQQMEGAIDAAVELFNRTRN